jgi:hypothetical protein
MKFLCATEFIHSGRGSYFPGNVYPLTAEEAGELIAADKKRPLGALSFFSPADEEAAAFIKGGGAKGKKAADEKETAPSGKAGK